VAERKRRSENRGNVLNLDGKGKSVQGEKKARPGTKPEVVFTPAAPLFRDAKEGIEQRGAPREIKQKEIWPNRHKANPWGQNKKKK